MSDWETAPAALSLEDKRHVANSGVPAVESGNVETIKPSGADEYAAKARDAGWVKPMSYNYDAYAKGNTYERTKLSRDENVDPNCDVPFRGAGGDAGFTDELTSWGASAAKYEWKDDYGDVGPDVPELRQQLFNSEFTQRPGNNMAALVELKVTVESEAQVQPMKRFEHAGLHPVVLENIKLCRYEAPTAIQCYCIPAIMQNCDVIAVAQTGSGKTAAFLVPVLSKLMGKAKKLCGPRPNPAEHFDFKINGVRAEPLVLIIVPTRELAVQIFDEARRLCYRSMLRPCVVYGGGPPREQADELRRGCDILIGTPGRLIDFLGRGHLLSLRRVRYTIIDEADELVSDDWQEDMKQIMAGGDNNEDADHRYMLFSATFPKGARALARDYLDDNHVRIRIGRIGSTHTNIQQNIIFCDEANKRDCLRDLLLATPPARTIIFVNNKRAADFLDDFLYNNGMPSTSIHSDRTQREREDAIRAFKSGKAPILVTTGVTARGLDIVNVMHVINYDLPSSDHGGIQEYIHRIGRTARIGQTGIASSFYSDRNEDLGPALTKILLESGQPVPDFLEQYKPEGPVDQIDFEDDSDEEVEASGDTVGEGDAWGAGGDAADPASGDAWGASPAGGDAWGAVHAPQAEAGW